MSQEKCRGWRMCISGCPYKKVYLQLDDRKVGEVHPLLSAAGDGQAPGLLSLCVGRIRYLGICCTMRRGLRAADAGPTRCWWRPTES